MKPWMQKLSDKISIRNNFFEQCRLHETSMEISGAVVERFPFANLCNMTPRFEIPLESFGPNVTLLPGLNHMGQAFEVEPGYNTVFVPKFNVMVEKNWTNRYNEQGHTDIWEKAIRIISGSIVDYMVEVFFRVLVPAVTGDVDCITAPDSVNLETLVTKMSEQMQARGEQLSYLLVGPEHLNSVRYGNITIQDTRIPVMVVDELGAYGPYNVNGADAKFGIFKARANGYFNRYMIKRPNIVDSRSLVTIPGETQIYGFSDRVANDIRIPRENPIVYLSLLADKLDKTSIRTIQGLGGMVISVKGIQMGVYGR